tara:strand:- start:9003 stop:9581 length:579 start_codon:yes stop_codon:yes gene_type:complete
MSSKNNKKDSTEDDSDNESKDSLNYSSDESQSSDESSESEESDESELSSDSDDDTLDNDIDQLSSNLINNDNIQHKTKDKFARIILKGDECKSLKPLNPFEIALILGHRAQHFEGGGKCLTSVSDADTPRMMAIKELLDGKNPLNMRRQIPNISKGIIVTEMRSVSEMWDETKKYVNIEEYLGISTINDTFK